MTLLVGIINLTPDSFSDGGQFNDTEDAIQHAERQMKDGAALLDVGAESTRPGATPLTSEVEWGRLEPVLLRLLSLYPGHISVDTYHPETVRRAAQIGPVIINDVTGMNSPEMIRVVTELKLRVIVSHSPSVDLQLAHQLKPVKSLKAVKGALLEKRRLLIYRGLKPEEIILDPGIGFGKSPELNLALLKFAEEVPGIDVMIGYSRKRFLGDNRFEVEPNLEAGRIAIAAGAKYLRVHDVLAHSNLGI